ncbi:MAG: CoA-binding protein [Desulfovibrio sp.]|uniref:CoA-binding protein n=1 Tax=Desulfovibrio sp. 7SRBS1 TaxID=3378064 RepID=UPI003B3ED2F4
MLLPNTQDLKALFDRIRTIAVVGAKDVPGQPVDMVGRYLLENGFNVIPVHPKRQNIWGVTTYPSLTDVPEPVDMVNVFRAPQFCPQHARETLELQSRPSVFWMQLGIVSPEAEEILTPQGIQVIQNECLMVVHKRVKGQA